MVIWIEEPPPPPLKEADSFGQFFIFLTELFSKKSRAEFGLFFEKNISHAVPGPARRRPADAVTFWRTPQPSMSSPTLTSPPMDARLENVEEIDLSDLNSRYYYLLSFLSLLSRGYIGPRAAAPCPESDYSL
jgi:hypothetical protein